MTKDEALKAQHLARQYGLVNVKMVRTRIRTPSGSRWGYVVHANHPAPPDGDGRFVNIIDLDHLEYALQRWGPKRYCGEEDHDAEDNA